MTIQDLLDYLDGEGLVITDYDMTERALQELRLNLTTEIEQDEEMEK